MTTPDIKHMTDAELDAVQRELEDDDPAEWEEDNEGKSHVLIAQYRCPSGHVLLVIACEAHYAYEEMVLHADIQKQMHRSGLTACPQCQATRETWRLWVRRTRYPTLAEADKALQRLRRLS